jgi:hypothetical protein
MTQAKTQPPLVEHMAIAVTCFDAGNKKIPLAEISQEWASLAKRVRVYVVTNNPENSDIREFVSKNSNLDIVVATPNLIGHPYLYTWIHRELFRRDFEEGAVSHFLYLEDDIRFGRDNLEYFLENEEALGKFGLFPGFLRYEVDDAGTQFATDVLRPESVQLLPRVIKNSRYLFLNLRNPYQGMYLMSRSLFTEFVASDAFTPDEGRWGIRERAAAGLTFEKVPQDCFSRNFVGYVLGEGFDSRCMIHHVSNRYAKDKGSRWASIPVSQVIESETSSRQRRFQEFRSGFRFRINKQALRKKPVWEVDQTAGV